MLVQNYNARSYWDIVVQHAALLNACTSPSICDPEITIFESDTRVVHDLSVFPPPGCFCICYRNKIDRADHKLDAQNEAGVFLGFCHLDNTFGAVILVNKALVVATNIVAFESVFPFKEKKFSFSHWESLHKLLGRNNASQEHNFDDLLPSESIVEPAAAASQSHQTQPRPSCLPVHMMTILSTSHQTMKMSKICLNKLLKTSRLVQFLQSIRYLNHPFEAPTNCPLQANPLWTIHLHVMGGCSMKILDRQIQQTTLLISHGARHARLSQ